MSTIVRYRALAVAPSGVSENSQFFLHTVTGRHHTNMLISQGEWFDVYVYGCKK